MLRSDRWGRADSEKRGGWDRTGVVPQNTQQAALCSRGSIAIYSGPKVKKRQRIKSRKQSRTYRDKPPNRMAHWGIRSGRRVGATSNLTVPT